GRLIADEFHTLGSTNAATIVQGGILEQRASFTNETLVLAGGTFFNNIFPGTWRGPVNVISNSTILVCGRLIIEGVISGAADLQIRGCLPLAGECVFAGTGPNTISGTITVEDNALLRLAKPLPFVSIDTDLVVQSGEVRVD